MKKRMPGMTNYNVLVPSEDDVQIVAIARKLGFKKAVVFRAFIAIALNAYREYARLGVVDPGQVAIRVAKSISKDLRPGLFD